MALLRLTFSQKVQLYACTVSLISLCISFITLVFFGLETMKYSAFTLAISFLVISILSLLIALSLTFQLKKLFFKEKESLFDSESNATSLAFSKERMEILLRYALANKEFAIYYQPKIGANTGKICGVEALLRWRNPELG